VSVRNRPRGRHVRPQSGRPRLGVNKPLVIERGTSQTRSGVKQIPAPADAAHVLRPLITDGISSLETSGRRVLMSGNNRPAHG